MRLKDKVILVTASTRGIGLAIVKKCAQEGAQVYMAARDTKRAQEIADTMDRVRCVYNDATKPETFTSMVEDVIQDAGRIDVLVNNFGTSNPGKDLDFANTDSQIFLDTVTLNLRSVFMASQAAAKHMARHGGGSIINISSVGGLVPDISQIAYPPFSLQLLNRAVMMLEVYLSYPVLPLPLQIYINIQGPLLFQE